MEVVIGKGGEMEFVIHVTEEDECLGPVRRDVAHRDGLLHRAGCVFLIDRANRVCLVERSDSKSLFGGCVDTACSFHVEYGESYECAAHRELLEETGVQAQLEPLGVVLVAHPLDRMMVAVTDVVLDPMEAHRPVWCVPSTIDGLLSDGTDITPWCRKAWPLVREWLDGQSS